VVLLPWKIPANSIFHAGMRAQGRSDNPEGHPCVVVRKEIRQPDGEQVVHFLGLTSFSESGSKGVPAHKSKEAWNRMTLCANQDVSVMPHNGLLDVEPGSEKFKKATYLNYYGQKDLLPIELKNLEPWTTMNSKPIQFSANAVQTIKHQHKLVQQYGFIF
jgi:hypothetical protein